MFGGEPPCFFMLKSQQMNHAMAPVVFLRLDRLRVLGTGTKPWWDTVKTTVWSHKKREIDADFYRFLVFNHMNRL